MSQLRKRVTYANVMSSIAVFLVLGGATAYAAKKIGSNQLKANSVTATKIKKNAVTTAKIKKDAVTGAKVKESTLGEVPSAASVSGRIPFSIFTPAGTQNIAVVGPFTIRAVCTINNAGEDEGTLQLLTSVNGAAMDDNNGPEHTPFDVEDNPADLYENNTGTGEEEIEIAEEPGLIAVAPDGTAIVTQNESIGFNIAGRPGQCYFGGLIQKIG